MVDGTGQPSRIADVGIDGSVITAVGNGVGAGRREIDAAGLLVTPGFVDVHTHYDGQATWDPELTPSSLHGVTTVVCGNCGVGFAPALPDKHDWLIQLMEGVEDIPGAALSLGINWQWETFPEYLDALERMPRVMDIACQVPHGPVRAYVMGERGARNKDATPADLDAMAAIVKEGVRQGALGFSSSRTKLHRALDGEAVPGTFAADVEMVALGKAVADERGGCHQAANLRYGRVIWTVRPGHGAGGKEGRPQHTGLRGTVNRCAADGVRLTGRRAAARAVLAGLQGYHRIGRSGPGRWRVHRRAPWRTDSRSTLTSWMMNCSVRSSRWRRTRNPGGNRSTDDRFATINGLCTKAVTGRRLLYCRWQIASRNHRTILRLV